MNWTSVKWLGIGLVVMLIGFAWMQRGSDVGAGAPVLSTKQTLPDGRTIMPNASPTPSPSPEKVTTETSTFTASDPSGKKQWDMKCTSITYKDNNKSAEGEDILANFYSNEQKLLATVKAKGATMNTETQDVQFHGVVHAWSPIGETLTVQTLRYDGKEKKFYGKDGVKMTKGTSVLTGDKLVADPNLKWVKVTGNVQVDLHSLAPVAVASPSGEAASPSTATPSKT